MPPERARCPAAGCQAVLVGSSSLALWDVPRQARVAKLTGHTVRARRCDHARDCVSAMRWTSAQAHGDAAHMRACPLWSPLMLPESVTTLSV